MNAIVHLHAPLPEGMPDAAAIAAAVFGRAIAPDPDMTIAEWADARRILSSESSAEVGPWRTARVPHAREIMDALSPSDPVQEVTFVAGTQVGKTEIGNNFVGYVIDIAPGPVMMVLPTSSAGNRSSKTRLGAMIDATPTLRAKVSDRARDAASSMKLKQFPGGVLNIAGANSASDLKSMPVRYLFLDEIDEYPDNLDGQGRADKLAEKRTDTFPRKKIYRASTTTCRETSKIWEHYQRSDRRKRYVPCPHCQGEQVLVWEQFRWETRKVWEVIRADDGEIVEVEPGTAGAVERDTGQLVDVWYECEHCHARIDEHHKSTMLASGRWVATRPDVRGHKGYQLPSYYSPLGWFSWLQVVQSRLDAERDPSGALLKTWLNTVAAEPWSDRGEDLAELDLPKRAAMEPSPYLLQSVPDGGLLLVAAVDVQGNRLESKVKAYGRGRESWLVDYQIFHGDTETSAPWNELDVYLTTRFRHASGATLRIAATAIDSGYRTQIVYDWCRPRRHRNIFPTKGVEAAGKAVLGKPSKQDVDHRGRVIKDGIELWQLGVDAAKTEIHGRLKITLPGPKCMHFPLGLPDEYYQQLTAERQVTRYVRGYLRRVWVKDPGAANEALDLEVMCYAAAIFAGLNRVNWDRLEAGLRATAQDLFVATMDAPASTPSDHADGADHAGDRAAVPRMPPVKLPPQVMVPQLPRGRRVRSPGVQI